jgi:ABC-2 type transport system ATP-binding protein
MPMLEIEKITKEFSGLRAVDAVSFTVGRGEAFALLGPNGAGKTTLIRILTALCLPTAGRARINGFDLLTQPLELKKCIGIVHQRMNIDNDLTAEENLWLHARLHHMMKDTARARIKTLLDFVELSERKNQVIRNFSGGMKRRLMIARAVLHEPKLLFLDEPTIGLDPQVRRRIWQLIRQMHKDGLTVFLTTHYIEEAEQLCQRVAIMDKGRLVVLDSPQNLCARYGRYVVEEYDGENCRRRFFPSRQDAIACAGQCGGDTYVKKTSLEDVFVELTGKKAADL